MREIYTGSKFSRNKFKGNFYWPSQSDGTTFDTKRPFYVVYLYSALGEIDIVFSSSVLFSHRIINARTRQIGFSEQLYFRTQSDLNEFLVVNNILKAPK